VPDVEHDDDGPSGFADGGLGDDGEITAARVKPEERGEDDGEMPGSER
jgi:hypothetical protein